MKWDMVRERPFAAYDEAFRAITSMLALATSISVDDAKMKLFATPGVVFRPRTTMDDVLHSMAAWGWIKIDDGRIKKAVGWKEQA
ncbi:MAG: hypothetical protein Q8K86_09505 [Candidatus Nanopelagicaceae bacterium]|nr:hypothetical protein [Candidatus Nanopelagicaceae bacterium]